MSVHILNPKRYKIINHKIKKPYLHKKLASKAISQVKEQLRLFRSIQAIEALKKYENN